MLSTFQTIISKVEGDIARGAIQSREACLEQLRTLGLSSFGELMFSLPNSLYPNISNLLPSMASQATQMRWTGAEGMSLLTQSLDFAMVTSARFADTTGRALRNAKILDFGSGYGRLSRLFYYFTPESNLYMVDPYQPSINECIEHGLTTNLLLSDPLPEYLPVGDTRFDFIYSFSVFTHLNALAARQCLATLGSYLNPNGLLVITIRPYEFWSMPTHVSGLLQSLGIDPAKLIDLHRNGEFVFVPTGGIDQDTYGDSSFDISWLETNAPHLKVAFLDHSLSDPAQLYVGLKRR